MEREELELVLRVSGASLLARETIDVMFELEEAKNLRDATEKATELLNYVEELIVANYKRIVNDIGDTISRDTRGTRVEIQGGLA